MAQVIYTVNDPSSEKSIEIREKDEFYDSKYTKKYTLEEAIEETSK